MPDGAVRGPLHKSHFGDDLRFGPLSQTQTRIFRYRDKRRVFSREFVELFPQVATLFECKPCTDASGINQLSFFINPKNQRAESRQPFGRGCVSGNDKLLLLIAFDLQPVSIACRLIR